MSPYVVAWGLVALSGGLIGWLVFRALRGFTWPRYVATALVVAWAVTPYRFDDEHAAPAFLVAAFRLPFVDENADPTGAILALGAASAGVLLASVLLSIGRLLVAKRHKHGDQKRVE